MEATNLDSFVEVPTNGIPFGGTLENEEVKMNSGLGERGAESSECEAEKRNRTNSSSAFSVFDQVVQFKRKFVATKATLNPFTIYRSY